MQVISCHSLELPLVRFSSLCGLPHHILDPHSLQMKSSSSDPWLAMGYSSASVEPTGCWFYDENRILTDLIKVKALSDALFTISISLSWGQS